ncbi:hypothetical protein YN1_3880 [Nanoarchaeota archaeon]
MRTLLFKFIFELIVLIILIIMIYVVVEALIGSQLSTEHQYIKYTKDIGDIFDGTSQQLFIPQYNPEFVPVLVIGKDNYVYIEMYKCSYNINSEFPSMPLWNVSEGNGIYLFAPDLSQCILIYQYGIGSCSKFNNNINVYISSLGGAAGYVIASPGPLSTIPQILVPFVYVSIYSDPITNIVFRNIYNLQTYIDNDTVISCSCNGGSAQCEVEFDGNSYPLECYLSLGSNIEACAELSGMIITTSSNFFTNLYDQDILTGSEININNEQYPYLLLYLGQFVSNPILLVENENGGIYFYYEIPVKQ